MKLQSTLFRPLILFTLILNMSCDDKNKYEPEYYGVPITSVEATSCVDLTGRENWKVKFGSESGRFSYQLTLNEKQMRATPMNEKEVQHFSKGYKEGTIPFQGYMPSLTILLVSDNYYPKSKTRISQPSINDELVIPNITNQTTKEGLREVDVLHCKYKGIIQNDLTEVQFTHKNALIDFELIDIPQGAKINIPLYNEINYLPYRMDSSNYRVICKIVKDQKIEMKMGSKIYTTEPGLALKNDTHYQCKIRFDSEKEKLLIEDLRETVWSEEGDILE